MVQFSQKQALVLSGLLWIGIGSFLLIKGSFYFLDLSRGLIYGTCQISRFTEKLTEYTRDLRQSILILICIAFSLGFFKGFFVFKKTVNRVVQHIKFQSISKTISLKRIYPKGYLFLIIGMGSLGGLFKFIPLSFDLKGLIDFSIGFGLVYGSTFYFRAVLRKRVAK